jgi:hypothetical protein
MSDDSLSINVKVSTRAAILAAKTVVGNQKVKITADQLAELDMTVREEIAALIEEAATLEDPDLAEPTFEAIKPILERRAKIRQALAVEARKADARRVEEATVEVRQLATKDNARSKALRVWVEKHGDDEQKARLSEGFLREEEILNAVAEDLIDVRGYEEYVPMHKGEVCDCACAGGVVFTKGAPSYMDASQYSKLTEIREQLPEKANAEPVEHRGKCPHCKCLITARFTARVTLPWEGWLLVREFSLK